MRLIKDQKIRDFINGCNEVGIELYLVGGAVRDFLTDKETDDLDFALTSDFYLARDYLGKNYKIKVDEKYQSIKFNLDDYKIEISHARKESGYFDYRHPDKIDFTDSIQEDSKRRDFTINAFYYKDEKIYDFYSGLKDLNSHNLKVIGDSLTRFKEDPLRILRMIRFACMDYNISDEDSKIIKDNSYLLKELSESSFNKEFDRILMLNNLYVLYEYKEVFESYFELKFKDMIILNKLPTLEEKKTYLGIKNKSLLYKYKDVIVGHTRIELTKLIYKFSREIVEILVKYYDSINDTRDYIIFTNIIENDYYDKKQLDISAKEIIKYIKKEELTGYYIDKISYNIIEGKLKNERNEIIAYLKEEIKWN